MYILKNKIFNVMIVGLILFLPVSVKAELSYDEPVSVSMPSAAESLTNPSSSPVSVSMPPVAESLTNPLSSPVSVSMPPAAESLTNPSSSPVSVSIPSSFDSLTAPYAYPVSVGYEDAKNLLTDIVALYYLDGNWNDSSGNDYHLTGINGIEFTAEAKSGLMAGYLDGVNDLAFGNTTLAPDVTDNFTVSFWAKPTASRLVTNESNVDIQTTSNQEFVQTPGNGGGNIAGAGISIGKNGISIFENVGGNITSPLVYDFATELTDWTQVTVVYENKIPRVYINGVPVHSGQQSLSDAVSPTLYTMGGAWGGTGFTGYLDELAVFSRSFTDADVADIFGNGLGKDLYAPTILSTVPVISSIINNNVNEIKIALNDVSGVNLIASLDDAYLFDSLQNSIDGTWSVSEADVDTINFTPFSSLSTGTYTAVINPVDTHGNTAQRLFSFTIDQVSPTVSGFAMSPSSPHRAEKVSFTFTFSEAMDMSLQPSVIFVNGDATLGLTGVWSGNKKYSGYYTFVTGDVNGSYDVTVSGAKDVAGNVMTEVVVGSFELDTVLPLIPGVNTMDEIVATANVTVTGTKETGTALLINNLQKVSINSDETWSAIVSLNEGTNNLTFKAKDSAGNVSSGVTRTVVRDTQAPKFTVVYDGTVTESAVTFGGTKEAGIYMTVKVDGSTEVIANIDESVSTTKWSYDTTLIEGITKTFTIRAEDRAGNTREESIQITYDGSAPQPLALGVLQADGDRDGSDVLLNWSAYVEPNDLAYYIIYVSTEDFSDVTTLTPATTVTKGKTSYVVGGLTRGETYYFAVVPTDSVVEPESLVNTASAVPYDTVAPEDVTNLKATAGFNDADGDFIEYSWLGSVDTNLDLTHYNIYLNGVLVDTIGKTVTSYKKTDLNENSLYAFKITAVDDTNYESGGVQLSAVTRLPNPAITNLTTDSGTASLYWALPSTAYTNYIKHYNVYRVESADTILSVTLMGEPVASVGSRSFGESGLTNGTTYQYAVTAVNKFGAENYLVNSKSAEPKADSVGPVITIGGVSEGSVITRPVTITLGATDSTGVSSLKLFIDDTAINSLTLANPSYGWNIVNTTDGSHIVKAVATDSLGNESELIISVTVNLATPSTPSLGIARNSSITESTLNNLPVTVDSIATTLILKVNGDIERTMPLSSYTLISLNGIDLNEGTNVLSVETSNRAGTSYSAEHVVNVDTGVPDAPVSLTAIPRAGGIVELAWQFGGGEVPAGYNVYTSLQSNLSGAVKVNGSVIGGISYNYGAVDDEPRYYGVTSVDSASNESTMSTTVGPVSADSVSPHITAINYSLNGSESQSTLTTSTGVVDITFTVNEPLVVIPFFSLEPQNGSPILPTVNKVDDITYSVTVNVTSSSPNGTLTYKFSGKDIIGNRDSESADAFTIDVKGPSGAVNEPTEIIQIASNVTVSVSLDESSVTAPTLIITDESGVTRTASLTSTDNITWTGVIDLTGLSDGKGTFSLINAKDSLGNTNSSISSGKTITLYAETPPAPTIAPFLEIPQTLSGGRVKLSWTTVYDAQAYMLYRSDADYTVVNTTKVTGNSFVDLPPVDGIYHYTISALGHLDSVGPQSGERDGLSDRTAPDVPQGLTLVLTGNGVEASWDWVLTSTNDETPTVYRFYRSGGEITSIEGTKLIATLDKKFAYDTAPIKEYRFYAVTALDAIGNESLPSVTESISFPVAPVSSLTLNVIDNGAPELIWTTNQTGIKEYKLYRNGYLISPTSSKTYTDSTYNGGTITYGVSIVDNLDNESPIREVTLPDLSIALQDGTALRRGVLENINIELNTTEIALDVNAVKLKVGAGIESTLNGPFNLTNSATTTVSKVAATELDAGTTVPVVLTAVIKPNAGVTANIINTDVASVLNSSSAMEIFNEPLVRGTKASVRLKVNNIGSSEMEFLTSRNNGPSNEVIVYLRDEDGNLFASGKLKQLIGSGSSANSYIVSGGSYAVARIAPGDSFTTEPITFTVPENAPDRVVIDAVIANTYYHYGKVDKVVAPGLSSIAITEIANVPYNASVSADKDIYKTGEPIILSGQAISTATNEPVANVPVKVGISLRGFDRFLDFTTDESGKFEYTYTPQANEAGSYSVWAFHPDLKDRTVQDEFSIISMRLSPSFGNISLARNKAFDINLNLKNLGGADLHDVAFDVTATEGISVALIRGTSALLKAGESRTVTLRFFAGDDAQSSGSIASLVVTTLEGLEERFDAALAVSESIPLIRTSPSYIDTGVLIGDQKVVNFSIRNNGYGTLKNAKLSNPSTQWMNIISGLDVGDIAPGDSVSVSIRLSPGETIPQGIYNDKVVITSDNHIDYTYHLQATVTSTAVGNVLFDVVNQFIEDIPNASITMQHQEVFDQIFTIKTGADGTAIKYDLPEGRYSYNISASNHESRSGTFVIEPGVTSIEYVALEVTLIDIEWSVTETTIQDVYQITVQQTFKTQVEFPVLVFNPPAINVPFLEPGQTSMGEITVQNWGLIEVYNVNVTYPTVIGDYDVEFMTDVVPDRLSAMEIVTIPYRVTRRTQLASYSPGETASTSNESVMFASYDPTGDPTGNIKCPKQSRGSNGGYEDDVFDSFNLDNNYAYLNSPIWQSSVASIDDENNYYYLDGSMDGYGGTCIVGGTINMSVDCEPCSGTVYAYVANVVNGAMITVQMECGGGITGGGAPIGPSQYRVVQFFDSNSSQTSTSGNTGTAGSMTTNLDCSAGDSGGTPEDEDTTPTGTTDGDPDPAPEEPTYPEAGGDCTGDAECFKCVDSKYVAIPDCTPTPAPGVPCDQDPGSPIGSNCMVCNADSKMEAIVGCETCDKEGQIEDCQICESGQYVTKVGCGDTCASGDTAPGPCLTCEGGKFVIDNLCNNNPNGCTKDCDCISSGLPECYTFTCNDDSGNCVIKNIPGCESQPPSDEPATGDDTKKKEEPEEKKDVEVITQDDEGNTTGTGGLGGKLGSPSSGNGGSAGDDPEITVFKVNDKSHTDGDVVFLEKGYEQNFTADGGGCVSGREYYYWTFGGAHYGGPEQDIVFYSPGVYKVKVEFACNDAFIGAVSRDITVVAYNGTLYGYADMMNGIFTVDTADVINYENYVGLTQKKEKDTDKKYIYTMGNVRSVLNLGDQGYLKSKIKGLKLTTSGGKFYENFGTDSTDKGNSVTDPNNEGVYWQDPATAVGDTKITIELKVDVDGEIKTHEFERFMRRRTMKHIDPVTTKEMQGADVKMLQVALKYLGISEKDTPGADGTPVIIDGKYTKYDIGTNTNLGTYNAVRRLKKYDQLSSTVGIADKATRERLFVHWVDYLKAINEYKTVSKITSSNSSFDTWLTDALVLFNEYNGKIFYSDNFQNKVSSSVTRRHLIKKWIDTETGAAKYGHWGGRAPYRITLGGSDESGSIGFDQIVNKYKYGLNSAHTALGNYNLYDPKNNVVAMAVYMNVLDLGGGFFNAVRRHQNSSGVQDPNGDTNYTQTDVNCSIDPKKYPYVIKRGTEALSGCYKDDEWDLLVKGLASYNTGSKSTYGSYSLPGALMRLDPPKSKTDGISKGYWYGLEVFENAGISLDRTFTFVDYACKNSSGQKVEPEVRFEYTVKASEWKEAGDALIGINPWETKQDEARKAALGTNTCN